MGVRGVGAGDAGGVVCVQGVLGDARSSRPPAHPPTHSPTCPCPCCCRSPAERERESQEALRQQKRRITRQWEVLNRLRARHAAAEARAGAEGGRLGAEYAGVARAFSHLQGKFRHFKAADLARFQRASVCRGRVRRES